MSAPDFYFAVNAMFRYLNDTYGKPALEDYWRGLGREYYAPRVEKWKQGGLQTIAEDWREYFAKEPQAQVEITTPDADTVAMEIKVCPAIKHLRDNQREIVPYFCEHCDHICGAMAEGVGMRFERTGGMGSCFQKFVRVSVKGQG